MKKNFDQRKQTSPDRETERLLKGKALGTGLEIGSVRLSNPFLLAPLAGITDKSMRSLCAEAGASLTYTEMISAKGLWYGDSNTDRLLEIGENEGPVAVQLFGSEPEIMGAATFCLCTGRRVKRGRLTDEISSDLPPLIDLNSGCPVPKIVRNGEGSALLKNPDRLYDVVNAMVHNARKAGGTTTPVTAKIRMGFARGENIAVEAAKAIEAAGAAAVTIHGRTREQFYDGRADWSVIGEVKRAVRIPVIGNGDIKSGADAVRMIEQTGCDGVMIARGALGNPWIFKEAAGLWGAVDKVPSVPTRKERIEMLIRHLDMVIEDKGEEIAVKEMRKHIGWYTKGMRGAAAIRRQVNCVDDAETVIAILRQLIS